MSDRGEVPWRLAVSEEMSELRARVVALEDAVEALRHIVDRLLLREKERNGSAS